MCVFRFVVPGTLTIHPMFELLLLRSFTIIIQQEIERESIILVFLATFYRLGMNTKYTPYFSEIPAEMLELQPPTFLRTIVARCHQSSFSRRQRALFEMPGRLLQ